MLTTPRSICYSRADHSAISGAAVHQPDIVTGSTRTMNRRQQPLTRPDTDDYTSYNKYGKRFHQPPTPEKTDQYEYLLDVITTLTSRLHTHNTRLLQTLVTTFRGTKDMTNEFEHLIRNNLHSMSYRLRKQSFSFFKAFFKKSNRVLPVAHHHQRNNPE